VPLEGAIRPQTDRTRVNYSLGTRDNCVLSIVVPSLPNANHVYM